MVKCPRCQTMVDELTQSACPKCSLALKASPTQQMASPQPPRNTRVSLTGEVIEDDTPYAPAVTGVQPAQPGMQPQMPPRPQQPVYPGAYPQRDTSPPAPTDKALVINLSVLFVVLILIGGGGYWKWTHRTNPKAQVERYIHAVQWLDFGVVYDLSATPPGNKSRREFVSKMNDKYDNNGLLKIGARRMMEQVVFTVSEPTINGDEATVPFTMSLKSEDPSTPTAFRLKNIDGIWKVNPLYDDPTELITRPLGEQAAKEGNKALKAFESSLQSAQPGQGATGNQ